MYYFVFLGHFCFETPKKMHDCYFQRSKKYDGHPHSNISECSSEGNQISEMFVEHSVLLQFQTLYLY